MSFCSCCPPVSVDVVDLSIDDLYTLRNRMVDLFALVVFPGIGLEEDHGISGWVALGGAFRWQSEGCHWLPLASCTHDQDLIGHSLGSLIWLDNGSSRDLDPITIPLTMAFSIERPRTILRPVLTAAPALLETEDI